MQLANATLKISQFGDTVEKKNLTPGEALLIYRAHRANGNVTPLSNLTIVADEPRTKAQELSRLQRAHTGKNNKAVKWVDIVFPGGNPESVPETFDAVESMTDGGVKVVADLRTPEQVEAAAQIEEVAKRRPGRPRKVEMQPAE